MVLARIGVAVPEPCRVVDCPPSSLRSLHLRCISCHAGNVGVALADASRVGGPGQNGSRLGPSSTETLLQFPQNPPAKRAGAIHDAVANSGHGSMESWEVPWVFGGRRLETRQSHGFKISRLNLAGPCRRLDGLGCCPALRLLGAPFPDPSSTTTHTTHAHGTRRPSSSKRPWDDRVGASLLAFFPRWRPSSSASGVPHSCCSLTTTTVREQGYSAVLRLADGGRAVDGPSGINRSTTSTVFPPVYRPLMISGACRRLLPVPPRRVMPDRDITAPQSLAQGHGLARDRHGQLWMFELQKQSRHPPGPKKIHTTARRSGVCLADHSSPVNQAHHSCTPGWASRYGRRAFSDLLCASLQQRCIALKELDSPPISCSGAVDERISISRDRQDRQQRRDVPVCDRVRPSAAAAASGDAMWEGRRTGW